MIQNMASQSFKESKQPPTSDLKPSPMVKAKSIPGKLHMNDKVHTIRLGICCMDKKFNSPRAKNVISRIQAYGDIDIIPFGDAIILHKPIHEWPRCDVLIAYFSKGYPTEKVITYCDKYKPCLINNLKSQILLRNRLSIKNILLKHNIPTPRFAVLDRRNENHTVIEYDDKIIVNGITIRKPFVEKPINAEDHHIYVYYKGGGSRRLFRKVGNRSSEPSSCSCIRREGEFIYEALIQSNKDIKAYTVGDKYVHAETRKAPTVDGIVERDVFNKEVRHKCRLTKYEKKIAQKVVDAFDQNVCGFDIVRSKDGRPFVIDVNGWSFVKNNRKYFDDCAARLRLMCLEFDKNILSPKRYKKLTYTDTNYFIDKQKMHILRGVFGIFRHGDRTPKQKYKCSTHNENVIQLISGTKKFKLKWTYLNNSEKILNFAKIARELYEETKKNKWLRISEIASMKLISTKMQFKACEVDTNGKPTIALCILKWGGELTPAGIQQCEEFAPKFRDTLLQTNNENQQKFLSNMQVFMTDEIRVRKTAKEFTKNLLDSKDKNICVDKYLIDGKKVQHMLDDISPVKSLINKAKQEIGHIFYNEKLRESLLDEHDMDSPPTPEPEMNSMFNFKEGELNNNNLVVNEEEQEENKSEGGYDHDIGDGDDDNIVLYPDSEKSPPIQLHHMSLPQYKLLPWAQRMLKQLQNPIKKCQELYGILIGLQRVLEENAKNSKKKPYLDESPLVMKQRWDKIIEELYDKDKKQFDCSKIPDVFDSCRYDLLHNRHILRSLPLDRLWLLTELLASFVMSQEYGLSKEMKLTISRGVCKPLFKNIIKNIKLNCLKYNGGENICRTFLYFTSESYLHSLRNALILSEIPANKYVMADIEGMECSYFSHAIIRIFEDPQCNINSPNRFYVDVGFSPGAYCNPLIDVDQQINGRFPHVELCGPLNGRFPLNKFLQFLNQ
eukprot:157715_1